MPAKLIAFLLLAFLFLGACHRTPVAAVKSAIVDDSAEVWDRLDTTSIFKILFDNPVMEGGVAVWKPNYAEGWNFLKSYDDSCHTALDTIVHFKDRDKRNCALMVFGTYRYIKDSLDGLKIKISGCHTCEAQVGMALFSQRGDGKWTIYKFVKLVTEAGVFGGGGVGGIGEFSLVPVGDSWTVLLMKQPIYAGMGEEEGIANVYDIEENGLRGYPESPLRQLFSFTYHHSVHDVHETPELEENTSLDVVPAKPYPSLRLVTTRNGRRSSRIFRYVADDNDFEVVKAK